MTQQPNEADDTTRPSSTESYFRHVRGDDSFKAQEREEEQEDQVKKIRREMKTGLRPRMRIWGE